MKNKLKSIFVVHLRRVQQRFYDHLEKLAHHGFHSEIRDKASAIRGKLVTKRWAVQPIAKREFILIGRSRRWSIYRRVVMFWRRPLISGLNCAMRSFRLKNSTGY